jgi:hypothetical protein
MLAVLACTFELLKRERYGWAGCVLALGLAKPHLVVLIPLFLATGRCRRMLPSFIATGSALAFISIAAIGGFGGVRQYLALIAAQDENMERFSTVFINTQGISANFGLPSWATVAMSVAVLCLAVAAGWGQENWRAIAAAALGAIVALPHSFGYDAAYLLVVLLCAATWAESRITRTIAVLLCTPVPWLMAIAPPPWSATMPICLSVLLATLAHESYTLRKRARQAGLQLEQAAASV